MLEREFFTQKRKEFLDENPRAHELEQWGKYCYVPLDIPRYDFPELVKWFWKVCKPTYKQSPDVANSNYGFSSFDAVDIMPAGEEQSDVWSLNSQPDFLTLFPDILKRIENDFPFKNIKRIRLWSSIGLVPPHRDHTKFVDYPSSFRISLYDENSRSTLWLKDCLPEEKIISPFEFNLPNLDSTNSFVWNNLRTKHSSVFVRGKRKIIIILDRHELDIDRYHDLMERSILKYEKFCMRSTRSISEYINL